MLLKSFIWKCTMFRTWCTNIIDIIITNWSNTIPKKKKKNRGKCCQESGLRSRLPVDSFVRGTIYRCVLVFDSAGLSVHLESRESDWPRTLMLTSWCLTLATFLNVLVYNYSLSVNLVHGISPIRRRPWRVLPWHARLASLVILFTWLANESFPFSFCGTLL